MNKLETRMENNTLTIYLTGKIDSSVSPTLEEAIHAAISANRPQSVVLDCEGLQYISSAGLRVILRLKKEMDDLSVINVNRDIYDIFDMTGFTTMIDVQKALRVLSIADCELIGEGASGKVYRKDRETVIKVHTNPNALQEIRQARDLARTAFIAGVPTAISYDAVRIEGGGYGAVYALIDTKNLAKLVISNEISVDEAVRISVDLLKQIHSKTVAPGAMPNAKDDIMRRVENLKDYLPEEQYDKLCALIADVPEDLHILHGDFHLKNILVQGGEALTIDMESLCHGHPIFELAPMYNAYCGYSAVDHSVVESFLGISYQTACEFWQKSLALYLDTDDEARIRDVENKTKIVASPSIPRRTITHGGLETPEGQAIIRYCKEVFDELLPEVDKLTFD